MRVSVITVAYNSTGTIGDTLASVAAQSHPDIEHIVVDGASTDDTLDVVRRLGTPSIKVVSERDSGIYDAMNKGLRLATGDLVGFLNADDVFADPHAIASLVRAAAAHPEAIAIYGDLVYSPENDLSKVLRYWRSGEFSRSRLRFGWMPPHPTFYVRAHYLETIGPFNDTLRIAADYEFMLRALTQPHVRAAYVPSVLVRMRAGGASNRSFRAMIQKSREDLWAMRENKVGGWFTLACKNLRKLPQFLRAG